jgi:hypothetical protein
MCLEVVVTPNPKLGLPGMYRAQVVRPQRYRCATAAVCQHHERFECVHVVVQSRSILLCFVGVILGMGVVYSQRDYLCLLGHSLLSRLCAACPKLFGRIAGKRVQCSRRGYPRGIHILLLGHSGTGYSVPPPGLGAGFNHHHDAAATLLAHYVGVPVSHAGSSLHTCPGLVLCVIYPFLCNKYIRFNTSIPVCVCTRLLTELLGWLPRRQAVTRPYAWNFL